MDFIPNRMNLFKEIAQSASFAADQAKDAIERTEKLSNTLSELRYENACF